MTDGTIETNLGNIQFKLLPELAPEHVRNFVKLAQSGFYDGTLFHRIIPGFMIQGGDPNTITGNPETWGLGGPGYSIGPEFSELKHQKYIVSMARGSEIDSAGSQFFIVLDDSPWLDGQYTIFGEVIDGKSVIDKIAQIETNAQDQPLDIDNARMEKVLISP